MLTLRLSEDRSKIGVERDRELRAGFLLNDTDGVAGYVGPRHPVNVRAALPGVEHQGERKPLLRSDRPAHLELRKLGFRP